MEFTIRDPFETDVDTYWREIFFDEEFNRRLYLEGMGFKGFELLELTGEPGGRRTRVMRSEPTADAPAVVKKFAGDSFAYTERGTFDPDTGVWSYDIEVGKLSDRVRIGGRLWAEPAGDGRCERVAQVHIDVKVFGIGGAVEKFIEKTTRESYAKATAFTAKWIAERRG